MLNYDCIIQLSDYMNVVSLVRLSLTNKFFFNILNNKANKLLKNETFNLYSSLNEKLYKHVYKDDLFVIEIGKYSHISKTKVIKNNENHVRIMTHEYFDLKSLKNLCDDIFYFCKYINCKKYNNYYGLICANRNKSDKLKNSPVNSDYMYYILDHPNLI